MIGRKRKRNLSLSEEVLGRAAFSSAARVLRARRTPITRVLLYGYLVKNGPRRVVASRIPCGTAESLRSPGDDPYA